MTEQEVFNKVWDHIITQGKPSLSDKGLCCYRGPDGLMCAAGIFLTDEQAEKLDGSGTNWYNATDIFPELEKLPTALISELQWCHDGVSDKDSFEFLKFFKESASNVAKRFKLTVPEGE